jgi:ketosteroid isomerase-like protein
MLSIEARLKIIEDRTALQDVLTAFCNAVDSLSDMDGLLNCFTEDAVFDLSGIHLPKFERHAEIRKFFAQVFLDMSHHAHCASNFTVDKLDDNNASCRSAVIGTGATHDGRTVLVYVRYFLDFVRTPSGWKIRRLNEAALMPLPNSLTDIHARD